MDTDLVPLLEKLDGNLEDLEGALSPLLKGALTDKAETLPILDRAHLYILVTYVIELLLSRKISSTPAFDGMNPDFEGRIPAAERSGDQGASSISRTGSSQAIHDEAQQCGVSRAKQEYVKPRQICGRKIHYPRFGMDYSGGCSRHGCKLIGSIGWK